MGLDGKTAVVTGSTQNIGLSIADCLGQKGAQVVINGPSQGEVDRALKQLPEFEKMGVAADLSKSEDCERLIERAVFEYKGIDILVNNAALLGLESYLSNFNLEDWEQIINVNLRAVLLCSSLAVEHMESGSSIVNISSPGARRAHRGRLIYDVSKGGLESATRCLARELGPKGIRVNAVIPGSVRTDRWDGLSSEEIAERRSQVPLRREVRCEDIAEAVAFLVGEEAGMINGDFLRVDGGVSALR